MNGRTIGQTNPPYCARKQTSGLRIRVPGIRICFLGQCGGISSPPLTSPKTDHTRPPFNTGYVVCVDMLYNFSSLFVVAVLVVVIVVVVVFIKGGRWTNFIGQ